MSKLVVLFLVVARWSGYSAGHSTTRQLEEQNSTRLTVPISNDTDTSSQCAVENAKLRARLERLEQILFASEINNSSWNSSDVSLLELFSVQIRNKLFSSIPPTDEDCTFSWVFGKCNPHCKCHLAPKFGDYSLTRACRLIPLDERDEDCDPEMQQTPWFFHIYKGISTCIETTKRAIKVISNKIVENGPPSDSQCQWSWKFSDFGCVPKKDCAFIFELGDYSLDRVCRLRVDGEDYYDEEDNDDATEDDHEQIENPIEEQKLEKVRDDPDTEQTQATRTQSEQQQQQQPQQQQQETQDQTQDHELKRGPITI